MATSWDEWANQGTGNVGRQQSGGITPERYVELYNQIYGANPSNLPQGAYQDHSEEVTASIPQMRGWRDGDTNAPTRQAGLLGRGALQAYDWGENLMGITGWDPNEGFTLPNIGRFALSLPFQMAGGLLETPVMIGEGITGQNLIDRDAEGNPYAYNLTDSQQLAQLANAGINVGGLFFGGTGKALGFGAELMGAEKLGSALMEKNLSGFARREVSSALGNTTRAKAAGIAAGSVFDAGEEAAEEYIQSYLDDERWNTRDNGSKDRALNAAAWGALGGGIMGGVSHTGHTVFESATATAANAASPANTANAAPTQTSSPDFAWLHVNQNANQNGDLLTSDSNKALEEKAKSNMDQAASGMVRLVADYNGDYSYYDGAVGVEDIYDQFHSGVQGSAQSIANAFKVTVKQMADILDHSPIEAARILNEMLDKMVEKPVFYVQKMPSANETTATKFDLKRVASRRGVYVHAAWPSMSNADKDGDKVQVFWDPSKFTYTPYAFQQIRNPLGQTVVKEEYTGFDDKRVYPEVIDWLEGDQAVYSVLSADPTWNSLRAQLRGNKSDDFETFIEFMDRTLALITSDQNLGVGKAKQLMDHIRDRNNHYNYFVSKGVAKYKAVYQDELDRIATTAADIAGTKGSLRSSFITDMRDLYNLVIWTDSEDSNPAFRANVYAIFEATERIVSEYGRGGDASSAYNDLVVAISGLANLGEKYVDQLSEVRRSMERYLIRSEWTKNGIEKITSSNEKEALKIAVKVLNDTRRDYMSAISKSMADEKGNPVLEIVNGSIPQEIDSDNASWNSLIFAQRFIETFGDTRTSDLFDKLTEEVKGLTLKQIAARIYTGDASQIGVQLSGAEYAQSLFGAAMRAHKHRGDVIIDKLMSLAESFVQFKRDAGSAFNQTIQEYLVSGANSSQSTILALSNWIMAFQKLMGIKGVIYASETHSSVASIGNALNNPFIKALLDPSKDPTPAQIVDSIASFRLSFRYKDIIEHIGDPGYDFDYAYSQLAGTTPLDTLLYEHYKENRDSDDPFAMLRFFCNPEKIDGEKQTQYEELFSMSSLSDTSSFLNDVFTGGEDAIGMGALNKDIKKAQRDIIEAKKQLGAHVRVEADRIRESLRDAQGALNHQNFPKFMRAMLQRSQSSINLQVFTNAIWTQQFLTKEGKEKAQVDRANAAYAMSVNQSVNGAMFAVTDAIFIDQGVIDIQSFVNNRPQFLRFLSGQQDTVTLVDYRTGKRGEITLKEFCDYITEDPAAYKKGEPLPSIFWEKISEKCPQVWSAIVPSKTGTIMTEGGLQTRTGMASQNIYDTIISEFRGYNESTAQFEAESRRAEIFNSITKSPGMMSVIAAICSKHLKVGQTNLAEARKSVEKAINDFVDYAVFLSFQGPASRAEVLDDLFTKYSSQPIDELFNSLISDLSVISESVDTDVIYAIRAMSATINEHANDFLNIFSINHAISNASSGSELSKIAPIAYSNVIPTNGDPLRVVYDKYLDSFQKVISIVSLMNNLNGTLNYSIPGSISSKWFDDQIDAARKAGNTQLVQELEDLRKNPMKNFQLMPDQHLTIDMFYAPTDVALRATIENIIRMDPELRTKHDETFNEIIGLYDPNNTSHTEERVAAVNKYNQRLLAALMNDLLRSENQSVANPWQHNSYFQATGIIKGWLTGVMNDFQPSQSTFSVVDRTGKMIRREDLERLLSRDVLDFTDASTSALFTQSLNSFNGSPISAGIGINGAKTNLFAAFGSLPKDYLQDQIQYTTRSYQREPNSMAASLIKRIINWEQEPLFLQLKKTLAGLQDVARTTRIGQGNIPSANNLAVAKADFMAPDSADRLRNGLMVSRTQLAATLKHSIKNGGFQTSDKIKLSDEDYEFMAAMVTPFINIRVGRKVFVVDSRRLFSGNPDWLSGHAQEQEIRAAIAQAADSGASGVSADIGIVSLDELSYKILRGTSNRITPAYTPQQGYVFDDALVREDAKDAALSWEYLNDPANRLSAADLVNTVPFTKVATGGRSVVGTTTSALQQWQLITGESMLSPQVYDNIIGNERSRRHYESISESELTHAVAQTSRIKTIIGNTTKTKLGDFILHILDHDSLPEVVIASFEGDPVPSTNILGKSNNNQLNDALRQFHKQSATGNERFVKWSKQSGFSDNVRPRMLIDINLSDDEQTVLSAYRYAAAGGRPVLVKERFVKSIQLQNPKMNVMTDMNGYALVASLKMDDDPIAIDPFSWQPRRKQSILVTLFTDKHNMGDTGASQAPTIRFSNKNHGRYELGVHRTIPLEKLLGRRNDIVSIINPSDAATILAELKSWKTSPPKHIDMRYWDKTQIGYDDHLLVDRMEKYLKKVQQSNEVKKSLNDVSQGDCIGFVRVKNGGSYDYAPIFWWGDSSTAKSLSLAINSNNQLEINGSAYVSTMKSAIKMFSDRIAYKFFISQTEDSDWVEIKGANGQAVSPDAIADAKVLPGRVVGQENTQLLRNAWWHTQMSGGNMLCKKDDAGNWIPSDLLSDEARQVFHLLIEGNVTVWDKVQNGGLLLFDSTKSSDAGFDLNKFNVFFSDFVRALRNRGCSSTTIMRIICPTEIRVTQTPNGMVLTEATPTDLVYDSEIDSVLKPFMYSDFDNVLRFWNMITPNTFPSSYEQSLKFADGTNAPFFMNALGQVWSNAQNAEGEKLGWCYCAIGPTHFMADSDYEGAPSTEAAMGMQPQISMMMDYNVLPEDFKDIMMFLINHNGISTTDPDGYYRYLSTDNSRRGITSWKTEDFNPYTDIAKRSVGHIDDTYKMMEYHSILREEARAIHRIMRIVDSKNLKTSAKTDSPEYKSMLDALESFNSLVFSGDRSLYLDESSPIIGAIVRVYHGLLEDGVNVIGATPAQVATALRSVKERIEAGQTMFEGGIFNTRSADERVCIGLLDYDTTKRLFDKSSKIRQVYQSMHSFVQLHEGEQQKALEQLTQLKSRSQENAVRKMIDATRYTHDGVIPSGFTGDVSIVDIMQRDIQLAERGLGHIDPQIVQALKDNLEESKKYFANINLQVGSKNTWSDTSATNGGGKRIFAGDTDIAARRMSEHLMSLNAMQRLSLPELFFSNVGERGVNQGAQRMLINLSKFHIGPFAGLKSHIDRPKGAPDLIKEVAHQEEVTELFAAMRTAEIHGFYQEFMERVRSSADVTSTITELMKEKGTLEKFASQMQDIISGKNILLSTQIENFLDIFDMHIDSMAPWWGVMETMGDGRKVSRFQRALETAPRDFLLEVFFGTGTQAGPDVLTAQKAYNWSKRGDMAQRNVMSAVFSCIADHNQVVKFLMSTLVTPFFQYQTDRLIKVMNWIAPMSSIHYVVTEMLSKSDKFVPGTKKQVRFNQLNLDSVQWNMTLREAMMTDMLQLGVGFTALTLLSFSGSVEPPDDEDKWCNFKEWTIFGQRIDEAWWIEDVLGLALPMLMWMRSAQLGMPRIDILVNGLTYYLSNNPAVKVADAVAALFDPFTEFYQEYDNAQDSFAKALGGPPSYEEIAMGKATSFGLSYLAQFITPAVLKEIYNAGIEYQPSWKRVYEENATGGLSKDAIENGATMMTSYQDAIIRKYTKNNPVMGFLADFMFNSPTGYMAHEMPDVIYYDPYQIDSLRRFSIYEDPETKKIEKSNSEKQAMALYIISLLQMYSVDELSAVGFILDSDTKAYVSEFLWDQVAECNRQWYELLESGNLDPYLLGEGDYQAGLRSKQILQDAYYKRINDIKSLYYDKLWADELGNLVRYRQKHTRYAQDANGDWYATGYYPGFISPLYLVPGESQTDGWQAVMSRENDWTAESAVIPGMSTGVRGLVPIPSDSTRTPGFETWSSDGTDTGYSNSGIKANPNARNNKYASYTPSGYSSYPRSSGGYSRGGGGGGGGSNAPDIYYRNNTPSTPSASTVRRTSRQKADMDYLRPNFETKGSREAYKRGDI